MRFKDKTLSYSTHSRKREMSLRKWENINSKFTYTISRDRNPTMTMFLKKTRKTNTKEYIRL
jgi:hypothetical protein